MEPGLLLAEVEGPCQDLEGLPVSVADLLEVPAHPPEQDRGGHSGDPEARDLRELVGPGDRVTGPVHDAVNGEERADGEEEP